MLGEVGDGVIIYTYISYIHIISYYMQRSQHVKDERLSRVGFDFDQILAKLYRKTGYGEPLVPFTDEDKRRCSEARVHVMINPHHRFHHRYRATSPCYDKLEGRDIPRPSCMHGHILSPINVEEFSKQGLIYSRVTGQNDTDHQGRPVQPGITEYWYLVQDEDHLSSYDPRPTLRGHSLQDLVPKIYGGEENTCFDDVARGYIKLVENDELHRQYELVTPCAGAGAGAVAVAREAQSIADAMADPDEPSSLLPMTTSSKRPSRSKGGNKSKKRKNKRKTRNKRRRNKTRKN
jgi:hypothetical protein